MREEDLADQFPADADAGLLEHVLEVFRHSVG